MWAGHQEKSLTKAKAEGRVARRGKGVVTSGEEGRTGQCGRITRRARSSSLVRKAGPGLTQQACKSSDEADLPSAVAV